MSNEYEVVVLDSNSYYENLPEGSQIYRYIDELGGKIWSNLDAFGYLVAGQEVDGSNEEWDGCVIRIPVGTFIYEKNDFPKKEDILIAINQLRNTTNIHDEDVKPCGDLAHWLEKLVERL
jgi:hypothetical protein